MNCNNRYQKPLHKIENDQKCIPKYIYCIGATGPTGPSGTADTITIGTVTTSEPGTEASVIDVTGGPNHILNFVIPRGFDGTSGNDFCCFCIQQMRNIIEQIATLYPNNRLLLTLDGGDAVVGNIGTITLGPNGDAGIVNIIDSVGNVTQLLSICSIDTIKILSAQYNEDITYLSAPDPLPPGCCTDCEVAIRSGLPVGTTNTIIVTSTQTASQGTVIRNEPGMIVLSNPDDNSITFVSSCRIDAGYITNTPTT